MLKKFILNILSSFVGTWLAIILIFVAGFVGITAIAIHFADSEDSEVLKDGSVLVINIDGAIEEVETTSKPGMAQLLNGSIEKPQAVHTIVESINEAKVHQNISGLYLKCGAPQASGATLNAIREAVEDFRNSGKKVFAYADNYSQGAYFVASAANHVMLNSYGEVSMKGLGGSTPFFKGLFDKLGIEFQVVKVGTFKSAVEPYILNEMSGPARAQLDTLYTSMWGYIKDGICKYRKKLTPVRIDMLIRDGITYSGSEEAMKQGFVDEVLYERQVDERIAKHLDIDKEDLNYVSIPTVLHDAPAALGSMLKEIGTGKNTIAILYATGEIVDGGDGGIDYQKLVPVITDLAEDENIKGMVLRVNSPGGSAFGSDQIGEALDYFQSKGKPLAVSMGDYAASGGYWISCGADRIFADPLTVTGSIGIFGLIPNVKGLTDKLGVNFETVSTNPEAEFPNLYSPLTPTQQGIMQKYVEKGYDRFISRVSKGRKMSEAKVRVIAEGRVWDAITAKKIGLVDELGSMQNAVEWVAQKAKISDTYGTRNYPEYTPSVWDMLSSTNLKVMIGEARMAGKLQELEKEISRRILRRNRVLAIMPEFEVNF